VWDAIGFEVALLGVDECRGHFRGSRTKKKPAYVGRRSKLPPRYRSAGKSRARRARPSAAPRSPERRGRRAGRGGDIGLLADLRERRGRVYFRNIVVIVSVAEAAEPLAWPVAQGMRSDSGAPASRAEVRHQQRDGGRRWSNSGLSATGAPDDVSCSALGPRVYFGVRRREFAERPTAVVSIRYKSYVDIGYRIREL